MGQTRAQYRDLSDLDRLRSLENRKMKPRVLSDLQQIIEMCSFRLRLLDNLKPKSSIESKTRLMLVSESL